MGRIGIVSQHFGSWDCQQSRVIILGFSYRNISYSTIAAASLWRLKTPRVWQ